jgi:hypothetical protein
VIGGWEYTLLMFLRWYLRQNPTYIRLFEPISANALAGHPCTALATKFFAPNAIRMVLADPAETKTYATFRSHLAKTPLALTRSFRQALERTGPQQTFRSDIPELNISHEPGLHPGCLRLFDGIGEFGFGTDDRIQLFPNLA